MTRVERSSASSTVALAVACLSLSGPPLVATLTGVVDAAAGFFHACAILTDGRVQCWGTSALGQLGDGGIVARSTPGDVLPFCP